MAPLTIVKHGANVRTEEFSVVLFLLVDGEVRENAVFRDGQILISRNLFQNGVGAGCR